MAEIQIPQVELVEIERIRVDGQNPNKMKKNQLEALKEVIVRWGFIIPIVTNRDLLLSNGEQSLTAARELGMKIVPVVRLDVKDVDRRLLRQILNKLRGHHVPELDLEEYFRIIEAGGEEDLKTFLIANDKQISDALEKENESAPMRTIYEVVVECVDEKDQKETYETLTERGYTCKVLTL